MKGGGPGDVHNYFSSMGSPVEAFAVYSRILSDLEARVGLELEKPELAAKMYLRRLPSGMGFKFSYEFPLSSGLIVHSLEEFFRELKTINVRAIEFHSEQGDFERWISQVVRDEKLAAEIHLIGSSKKKLHGEQLRKKVLNILEKRIKKLKKITAPKSATLKKQEK
jgi:alpha-amylase